MPPVLALLAAFAAVILTSLALAGPAPAALVGTPQTVQEGLATPWEVAPVPDGRMFITERDEARVRVVLPDGTLRTTPAFQSTPGHDVFGLALHPRFLANRFVYLFRRYDDAGTTKTQVVRLVDDGTDLRFDRAIFSGIPSGDFHDGGRIVFGPDGKLYVTTGDQHDPSRPRDLQSLNGKILRLEAPGDHTDGDAPADNPFVKQGGNARFVWSYGHRHPQGLAFDAQGRLWETEHGPSGEPHAPAGATCCRDELNLIVKGGDYGWPLVAGDQTSDLAPGARRAVVHSGDATWAPGDLAFGDDGNLYAPALRGEHLHVFEPSGETIARHFALYQSQFGRLRVAVPSGGALFFATDGPSARLLRAPFDTGAQPTQPPGETGGDAGTDAAAPAAPFASPAADLAAPRTSLWLSRRQRPLRTARITLLARCDERCTLRLTGRLTGRRRLPSVTRRAAAGKRVRLTMKLSRRLRRTLARDLRRGRKVTATLRLRARDAAANARTRTVRVRVVR